ncbi:hypothetical protein TBLA_0D04720 [Henningerozyma blattae CBS 6284]|uniref:Ergosterol biosynthesis protein n=1 Tax=Henningerozyma blattae (strain ATCC 34711 / CBS 6284 / DSM 70876 / NBRC 10599 / NRRL Y-10934 / UCD 77-7) TaxID=1071380 RepID=I2H3L6_HENB6|nr:hypothetical protein TBLA_0D04720 [Tetrapisispora blattae CBS 6284]CCH60968.1 hypothetical protein TBLA_0D04720 [Tetrapisispora blattae CBS 6284]
MLSLSQIIPFVKFQLDSNPQGYLPKWLLFISIVSLFNSCQTYLSGLELTRRVYENKPLETTYLSARTFGTWTIISSIIRLYGSLFITESHVYQLVFLSYIVALFHFSSEWLIFRTCKLGKGIMGPFIVATTSLTWMYLQKEYYTGSSW